MLDKAKKGFVSAKKLKNSLMNNGEHKEVFLRQIKFLMPFIFKNKFIY